MADWIEFFELALQGFYIMIKSVIAALLIIPYIISWILVRIFRLPKIFSNVKIKKEQKNISVEEFEGVDAWKMQEEGKQQSLEYEYAVLENTFRESLIDKDSDGMVLDDVYNLNTNMAQVRKDLYNFKVLDSIDVKKTKIAEGTKINAIRENNSEFDVELFKKWSLQIFKLIKLGSIEELQVVRKVMSQQLFDNFIDQMRKFENDGLRYVTENLIIKDISLYDYAKAMSKEEIKILVNVRMQEYIKEIKTERVIRGNKKKSCEKKILMTFIRQDVKGKEGFLTNCPNCGAESTQVEFGKCNYCDTLVFPIRYNWTLIKFETI